MFFNSCSQQHTVSVLRFWCSRLKTFTILLLQQLTLILVSTTESTPMPASLPVKTERDCFCFLRPAAASVTSGVKRCSSPPAWHCSLQASTVTRPRRCRMQLLRVALMVRLATFPVDLQAVWCGVISFLPAVSACLRLSGCCQYAQHRHT